MAIVAGWLLLLLVWGQQHGELVALRRGAADARASVAATDGRLAALTDSEASLGSRVDGLFDPAAIISATEPSVFTLVAGAYQGSAFVLASGGGRSLLVTNFHVIRSVWTAGVRRVVVRSRGRSFNAAVTTVRPQADLAVLRVTTELPALDPSATAPAIGQPVVSVGSPYGFGGTASVGIVSAMRARFLQFSAPVSPGSSGGPLLDGTGAVVGVAAAKVIGRGAEGLSFAIPLGTVCRLTAAC
jgi:putative serine protease PepD